MAASRRRRRRDRAEHPEVATLSDARGWWARLKRFLMETEIKTLTARLLAHRVVPRGDALAKKALLDDSFRLELDKSLAAVGLRLVENPYAEHIAVALLPEMTEPVFGSGDAWLNNNLGLPRDVALLVILWALIILPSASVRSPASKPARKTRAICSARKAAGNRRNRVHRPVRGRALRRLRQGAGRSHPFQRQPRPPGQSRLHRPPQPLAGRGPMLDLMIDYAQLAPRIIEGALADVLLRREGRDAGRQARRSRAGSAGSRRCFRRPIV